MNEYDRLRLESLAAGVTAAEEAHAAIVGMYSEPPSRELAIAAVLDNVRAVWTVESRPGDGPDDWASIRDLALEWLAEQTRVTVFELLPVDVRRKARAGVVADMVGPGDDDGS